MSVLTLVRSLLLPAGLFALLLAEQPMIGQVAKDKDKDKDKAKKKADLLVPDPLEYKAGDPISATTIVTNPLAIKGAVTWTVEPKRHRGWIGSIAASPDGALVATSGGDGLVRLWESSTGKFIRILAGHGTSTGGLAFSPDGNTLATTSGDGTARVWNIKTGMVLRILRKHKGPASRVAWAPDGQHLIVTGGSSGYGTYWDPAENKQIKTVEHGQGVYSVAWSHDGKIVATCTLDGVSLWRGADGAPVGNFKPKGNLGYSVSWSPDNSTLAVGGRTCVTLWNVAKDELIRELDGLGQVVSWSPDGQKLATSTGGAISIWNTTTWNRDRNIPFAALSFSWDKSSTTLFAGSQTEVMVIDNKGDRGERTFQVAAGAYPIWSLGRPILSGFHTNTLQAWDPLTGRPLPSYAGHTLRVDTIEWSRDGKFLATGSADKTARVFESKSGMLVRTHGGHEGAVSSVAWGPEGRLVTGSADKIVRIFGANDDDPPKVFKGHKQPVRTVAWSRDGSVLASGGNEGFIYIWDLATGMPLRKLPIDKEKEVVELAFSVDGRLLAATCADAAIRIFASATGKQVTTLGAGGGSVSYSQLAWTNDGQHLLASINGGVVLWDLKTSTVVPPQYRLLASTHTVAWAADQKTVVASCFDRCIRFCDAAAARPRVTMILEPKQVVAVAAEGHFRAAADLDSELVYVVQTDKTQETLEPKAFAARFTWKNNPAAVKP